MEERFRFVEDWQSGGWSLAELCRHYGVSRTTGYKWIRRYEAGGLEGLRDESRAPHRHPNAVGAEVEEWVLGVRARHPHWGAPKIRAVLERERAGERIPAVSTIGGILRRHGLSVPQKRRRRSGAEAGPLAEAGRPNAVWCADFKGWFRSRDGTRIDPLTITDAYSRYVLRCVALGAPDTAHSRPVFEAAFREFGLPERIRSDNGPPFGTHGESGLTGLMVWFIRLGIVPEHIEAGRPQQNGRHERMHRTLKQETASPPAASRRAQQERFERFRREYNEQRPHQALQQQVPAAYYEPSARPYPERLPEVGYPPDWEVRRVSASGQMRWRRQSVFVGHALKGERVGLEPLGEGWWQVWFSFYQLGFVDESRGKLEHVPARRARPKVGRSGRRFGACFCANSSRPTGSFR